MTLSNKIKVNMRGALKLCQRFSSAASNHPSNSLRDILQHWREQFQVQKISEPGVSAELIIAHVLGRKTLHGVDKLTLLRESQIKKVNKLCQLRLTRMPVQYVIGEWDFHGLTLKMRPPVLIPRPETEELAKLCVDTLSVMQGKDMKNKKFLEIGVGSGALSIALLRDVDQVQAVALDVSPAACRLTMENAEMSRVADRMHLIEGDFNDRQVQYQLSEIGPFCMIISNPPYITSAEMKALQPEIHRYEDHRALDGGDDGMDLIRPIIDQSVELLETGGHLWLEVAPQHPSLISQYLKEKKLEKLSLLETVKDVFGLDRFCHLKFS